MISNNYSRFWLGLLLTLDAAGLGWAALVIFHVSGGSGRALAFGLSGQSLALFAATILLGLVCLASAAVVFRQPLHAERLIGWLSRHPRLVAALLTVVFIVSWLVSWTPPERFGTYYFYALRLLPLAGWLCFASGMALPWWLVAWKGFDSSHLRSLVLEYKSAFAVAVITILLAMALAWLTSARILDVTAEEEDYWYGAGVPVLAWQVLTALAIGWGFAQVEKKFLRNGEKGLRWGQRRVNVLAFIIVWGVAAFLWTQQPIQQNFMISGPMPPNFELYPAADGEYYDYSSQFALIGQKLHNGEGYDRPLYAAFLFYLHLLVGTGYQETASLQAALLAVFPALAFLIGTALHSHAAGLTLAALLTLRGLNGLIAGSLLENANQHMYLADFPTAVFVAIIIWLLLRWTRQADKNWLDAAWASGVIALGGYLRPHLLVMLGLVVTLAICYYWRRPKFLLGVSGLLLVAFLAAALPWSYFNGNNKSLFDMYSERLDTVIRQRYPGFRWPWQGSMPASQAVASHELLLPMPNTSDKQLRDFGLDHFLHNISAAMLSLPLSPRQIDLTTLIKKEASVWQPYWDGHLSPLARAFLSTNIGLVALGIGLAWKRARWTGLLPLVVMLLYFLMNSIGRTSGGRYIVPVDWVLMLYYCLGWAILYESITWLLGMPNQEISVSSPENRSWRPAWQAGLLALAILFGIGLLIPLTSYLFPPRFPSLTKAELFDKVGRAYLPQLGLNAQQWQQFSQLPEAGVIEGLALYPRFAWRGINPMIAGPLFTPKLYSRMSVNVIGQHGWNNTILPYQDEWFPLPDQSVVITIGCWHEDGYLEAWAIIDVEQQAIYWRHPPVALTCPLPEPVCDNNGWCRYE